LEDRRKLLDTLAAALKAFDWETAARTCDQIAETVDTGGGAFSVQDAREILASLRLRRRFREMEMVADAFLRCGIDDARIRRQYAQAMIDQGNLFAPKMVLESILAAPGTPAAERIEARGLLGRLYKQLYVNSRDPASPKQQQNLRQAIRQYLEVYDSAPSVHLWHGVNTTALLARGRRDGINLTDLPDHQRIASDLLAEIERRAEDNPEGLEAWDRATAVEACVALGDIEGALDHASRYARADGVGAFHIGSLHRQLQEVWELGSGGEPGRGLLRALESALLANTGGALELASADVTNGLEKNFGGGFESYGWYKAGLERCESVARVETLMKEGFGTGFLLDGGTFFADQKGEPVLLTNAHVISPERRFPDSLAPEEASVFFEVKQKRCGVAGVLWWSAKLDATLVKLTGTEGLDCCPLEPPPKDFDGSGTQRLYVIGHPLGGSLSFSLQDSIWLDSDGTLLHYRTATERGSSGSPVFDQKSWIVVGLHHKGKSAMRKLRGQAGTYEANEAIAITAIRNAVRESAAGAGA
jgi:hypothetical protein